MGETDVWLNNGTARVVRRRRLTMQGFAAPRVDELDGRARMISYDTLTDIITGAATVIGMF